MKPKTYKKIIIADKYLKTYENFPNIYTKDIFVIFKTVFLLKILSFLILSHWI